MEGVTEHSKKKWRKAWRTDEVFWDRVAIPHEHVTPVLLALLEQKSETERLPVGYQPALRDVRRSFGPGTRG
jgi:hypothetical protein